MSKPIDVQKLYEAMSAMQKGIRRAQEDEAGYWFWLMAENGWAKAGLNRLRVIAWEDIGAGDPMATLFAVRALDDAIEMMNAKNDGWRLPAVAAILSLCRARKSRETDHYQAAMRAKVLQDMKSGTVRETPDHALDKHTRRGKRMGRGIEHFRTEGAKLIPPATDEYETAAYAAWSSGILASPKTSNEDKSEPSMFGPESEAE